MSELSLDIAVMATVNGSGIATTLPVGPSRYLEEWEVSRYSISLPGGTGSVCRIYETYVDPTRQRDYTTQGQGDTAANANMVLQTGDQLIAQWTGVLAAGIGQIATITFKGTIKLPHRRVY